MIHFYQKDPSIESEILIEKSDIILSINNNKISSIEDFDRETFKLKHGDNIIIKLKEKIRLLLKKSKL